MSRLVVAIGFKTAKMRYRYGTDTNLRGKGRKVCELEAFSALQIDYKIEAIVEHTYLPYSIFLRLKITRIRINSRELIHNTGSEANIQCGLL